MLINNRSILIMFKHAADIFLKYNSLLRLRETVNKRVICKTLSLLQSAFIEGMKQNPYSEKGKNLVLTFLSLCFERYKLINALMTSRRSRKLNHKRCHSTQRSRNQQMPILERMTYPFLYHSLSRFCAL